MTIREATLDDVPRLVEMGGHFLGASSYRTVLRDSPEQMAALASLLITSDMGVVFVVDNGRTLVGMLGLLAAPHFLSGELSAGEIFWWVEPSARGRAGLRLLRTGEQWAESRGALSMQMIAPDDRLGQFYERRGYVPLERSYIERFMLTDLLVFDDVLADPLAYRAAALAQPYQSVTVGAATFHGIAPAPDTSVLAWVEQQFGDVGKVTTFLRLSPAGQLEPNYIHTDQDMGAWTGILYLTPEPATGDGTTFWRWRASGAIQSTARTVEECLPEWVAWRDLDQWEPWQTVEAKLNRLVCFPAPWFHSRSLFENYGETPIEARLIQVVFGGTDERRH